MTIRFKGHVHSLAIAGKGKVSVRIHPEVARSEPITIEAEPGEVDVYKPGTELEIAITPTGKRS